MEGVERNICCCGTSTWCKVIAWIQIIGNGLLLALTFIAFFGVEQLAKEDPEVQKGVLYAGLSITLLRTLLGLMMGWILLKGTKTRNVVYLRAWLIWGVINLVFAVLSLILDITGGTGGTTLGATIVGGIFGLGITAFTIAVVHIHRQEIQGGSLN